VGERVTRRSARAILLDGDEMLLIERTRPGSAPYKVTIGGGCEPEDEGFEDTLRREAREEAGAVIDIVMQVLLLTDEQPGGAIAIQHFFLAALVDMDLSCRTGSEFAKPERGGYRIVRVPFTDEYLARIDLRPARLAVYLRENRRGLAATVGAFPPDRPRG
jgi:8-oxo-dGTP pyrophosphatase MutT (NUDIX family)